jgi:hypothetical protein
LLELDPASEVELAQIADVQLVRAVERVRRDPSGRREPRHTYTRRFRNPSRFLKTGDRDVWEFRTSKYRALFVIAAGSEEQRIYFLPIKGKRFMTLGECPWHKGK